MTTQKTGTISLPGILAACLVSAAALVCAQTAAAAVTTKKSIWGPAAVGGVSQFPIYEDLGVGIWQHALSWRDVAPTRPADPRDPADPAYRWPALDAAIAEAGAHGIDVSLLVMATPGWANGGRSAARAPSRPRD